MKLLLLAYRTVGLFIIVLMASCKKEHHENGLPTANTVTDTKRDRPPVANAGSDQVITLPTTSIILDASGSIDPDNNIEGYMWTNISGSPYFNIINGTGIATTVNSLVAGIYLFELKVTDATGLFATDTVQITVLDGIQPGTPGAPSTDNVIFFFRDPTGGLDLGQIAAIESLGPTVVLVRVSIEGYPSADIGGVFAKSYAPRCPASSNYVDATSFGTFELPPGTYKWVAESETTDLDVYGGIPESFREYWKKGPYKAEGTIVVPISGCIVEEIIF